MTRHPLKNFKDISKQKSTNVKMAVLIQLKLNMFQLMIFPKSYLRHLLVNLMLKGLMQLSWFLNWMDRIKISLLLSMLLIKSGCNMTMIKMVILTKKRAMILWKSFSTSTKKWSPKRLAENLKKSKMQMFCKLWKIVTQTKMAKSQKMKWIAGYLIS